MQALLKQLEHKGEHKMAISVKELIEQKEKIEGIKKTLYDIKTSIGIIIVKQPEASFVADVLKLDNANELLILDNVIEPNLKDNDLQKAYNCVEPTDIVNKLFKAGEVGYIATAIMNCAGYKSLETKVHEELKN